MTTDSLRTHQTQPRFMDKRRRLERLVGQFVCHLRRGKLAQFLIIEWEQFVSDLGSAPRYLF